MLRCHRRLHFHIQFQTLWTFSGIFEEKLLIPPGLWPLLLPEVRGNMPGGERLKSMMHSPGSCQTRVSQVNTPYSASGRIQALRLSQLPSLRFLPRLPVSLCKQCNKWSCIVCINYSGLNIIFVHHHLHSEDSPASGLYIYSHMFRLL